MPWRTGTAPDSDGRIFRLSRCTACGTAQLADPGPAAPELYATGTYSPGAGRIESLIEPLRRLIARDRRRLIGSLPASARVLDVGAGRGRLAADLAAGGSHVVAVEPAPEAAAEARARGLDVRSVVLEEASFPAASFDRVVAWHSLEHLDDPAGALQRIRPWIAPHGRVVIAVPNLASLQARIGGDRWFHQDVPRHRIQLTPPGIRALLERTGYTPARIRHVMVDQNPFGMWLTLLNRLTSARDVPFRFLKRNLSYRRRRDAIRDGLVVALVGPLLAPVAVLLEAVAGLAGRGGTVVAEASVLPAEGDGS